VAAVEADPSDSRGPTLRSYLALSRSADVPPSEYVATLDASVQEAEKAVSRDARDAEAQAQRSAALMGLALAERARGDHAKSRSLMEAAEGAATAALDRARADRAYRRQGRSIAHYFATRGGIRYQRDDTAGAKSDYDEVLARNPNDPSARSVALFASRFLDHQAVIRDAEALFQATGDATHLFDVGFAWQMIGYERADLGDASGAADAYGKAIATYDRASVLAPSNDQDKLYRGETRVLRARIETGAARENDLDLALADFDASFRGVRGDAEVFLRRSALLALRGDTTGALLDIDRAVGDDKGKTPRFYQEQARILLARAKVLADEGKASEARALLSRVVPALEIALDRMPDLRGRILPLMATAEARSAAVAATTAERDEHLAASRARLDALEAIAREDTREDVPRLEAAAALVRAEIAFAAGDPKSAVAAARDAIARREAEHAARRWSLDATWYERLADFLAAAGDSDAARATRERAAGLPR